VAAIEAEDEAAAIAHIRGALEQNLPYASLHRAIGEAALAHYADFGHCAIYTLKAGQLIERLGDEVTEPVLLAFLADATKALYDHGIPEPIISCHRLKVLLAVENELEGAPDAPWADVICAAVNRYLETPMKRHHGLRIAAQALEFVAKDG
jgi:hypothetical protein